MPVAFELLISFSKVGLLAWGGGPAMVPLVKDEVVTHQWMTEEQFADALAAGYALPGPIATKLALYVGYEEGGWLGAAASLLGVVLPSAVLILGLLFLGSSFSDHPRVQGVLAMVRPIVLAMLVLMVVDLAPSTVVDPRAMIVAALALLMMILRVPPAAVIGMGAILGATLFVRS